MGLHLFANQGYTIIPNQNLVKNIGFDKEATHTKFSIDINQIQI